MCGVANFVCSFCLSQGFQKKDFSPLVARDQPSGFSGPRLHFAHVAEIYGKQVSRSSREELLKGLCSSTTPFSTRAGLCTESGGEIESDEWVKTIAQPPCLKRFDGREP